MHPLEGTALVSITMKQRSLSLQVQLAGRHLSLIVVIPEGRFVRHDAATSSLGRHDAASYAS